jgi:hypothetical protein
MKVRTLLAGISVCLLGISTAMADPAVYRDDKLIIPSAVLINATTSQYYSDVVLTTDAAGKLQIVSASPRPLVASVDSVIPVVTENDDLRTVKLTIAGNKSVPCVALEEVAVSRKDAVFTLVVAESVMGPAQTCIAVLDPFEVTVPLDVSALPAGTYAAVVNGKEVSFVLATNP